MKTIVKAILFVISCIPFALQSHGLWIYNKTNEDIQYNGNYSGVIKANLHVHFTDTPSLLSIKRGSLWTPLETYLLKMHIQKKGKQETIKNNGYDYHLVGNIYIAPSGITTDVCHRNVWGAKL
jgi:hypothetical protein